jgi:hypothetical protein
MRPKWLAITNMPLWRYLTASSGFWNCAAAGSEKAAAAKVRAARRGRFMVREAP